jgi:hypothetical protein
MTRKEFIRNLSYDEKVQILKEYKDSGAPTMDAIKVADIQIKDGLWQEKCKELYPNTENDNFTLLVFVRDIAEEVAFESIELLKKFGAING